LAQAAWKISWTVPAAPGRNTIPERHRRTSMSSRWALWKYFATDVAKAFGGSWP